MTCSAVIRLAAIIGFFAACQAGQISARGTATEPERERGSRGPPSVVQQPAAAMRLGRPRKVIRVAVTFDDLPAHGSLPQFRERDHLLPQQSILDVHRQILSTLAAHRVPSVYGFINGFRLEQLPDARRVLELWRDAGHPLGNHTWAHPDLGEVGAEAFIRDIDRNDELLAELMGDGDEARHSRRVFRYPFLRQGRDRATLDAVRAHLARNGYRLAEVTINFGDWAYNEPFVRCSAASAHLAVESLSSNFVGRGLELLRWSDAAALAIYGRSIPHVLLLHSGAFDAAVLDALLSAYEKKGVQWIPLDEAFADAAYQEDVRVPARFDGTLLGQRIERDQPPGVPPHHLQVEGLLRHVCRDAPPELEGQ